MSSFLDTFFWKSKLVTGFWFRVWILPCFIVHAICKWHVPSCRLWLVPLGRWLLLNVLAQRFQSNRAKITHLGCVLDKNLWGETMSLQVIKKINTRLRFSYRKNRFLSQHLGRLMCNALIQIHFDYACSAWYPNLNKNLETKLQTLQNKMNTFLLEFVWWSLLLILVITRFLLKWINFLNKLVIPIPALQHIFSN